MASHGPIPLYHVIGFTGHRDLADPAAVGVVIREQVGQLARDYPANWTALSSVASGADTIFAGVVLELGMQWRALLPMPASQFREDFSAEQWTGVEALLKRAAHVEATGDGEDSTREHAYLDCGHETVNESDVLIAVWDREDARGTGGTAEVVAHARRLGKPIVIIDPTSCLSRREGFAGFRTDDDEIAFIRALPVVEAGAPAGPFGAPPSLVQFQAAADAAAMAGSPRLRTLATMVIVLHSVAALIAAMVLAFRLGWVVFAWLESACVAAALISALVYRRSFRHHAWVRSRLVAEISRAVIATWGLPRAASLLREIEIPGIRRLLNSLRSLHQNAARGRHFPLGEYRSRYIRDRIDDQLAYYRRQEGRALPRLRWLRAAFYAATTVGVGLTFANAVHMTIGLAPVGPFAQALGFGLLPIVLPALAASCISIISINDLQRRVARYREMIAHLGVARTQVTAAQTWSCLEREVNKCERLLLQEVLEWHTITSFSDAH